MSQEPGAAEAVAAMRRFITEVQQDGKVDLMEQFIHPDFVDHTPEPGNPPGLEGVYEVHKIIHSALEDRKFEIVHCVSDGKVVATSKIFRGKQVGDFFGSPATGETIQIHVMDFMTFVDGRFKDHWATLGSIQKV